MDNNGGPQEGAMGAEMEDLPQIDGLCDSCEPDEAQPATHVCHVCSFAFCPVHSERHISRTHHPLKPYNHMGTQADRLSRVFNLGGESEGEACAERAAEKSINQDNIASLGVEECNGAEEKSGAQNDLPLAAKQADEAEGAEAGQEAMADGEVRRRSTVTVERLRCKEHGEEGSLYCKLDEKIICVVCAVQGEHKDHEIITLHEAYVLQKSRQGYDLVGSTQQMADNIKIKWTSGEMATDELEDYVTEQFDELRKLVLLEEKRTLHLVDLKEAFLTATAAEKIAEITVETERLQNELANITNQLCLLEQAEAESASPAVVAEALAAAPGTAHTFKHDTEARPRLPEPRAEPINPQDYEDDDSGPSMDHAP